MSHELRTPLNAIIGLTEMMVKNAARFGTEKAQEPLQRVNRAGTHLLCSRYACRAVRPPRFDERIEQELFAHVLEEVLLAPALEHAVGDLDVAQVPSTGDHLRLMAGVAQARDLP